MSDTGLTSGLILKRAISIIAAVTLLICLDQLTKAMAVRSLKFGEPFILISGVLELRYVENTGAAFGMLQGRSELFFIIALAVSALLFYAYIRLPKGKRYRPLSLCFIFIIAGALGNLIDRIRLSYVVDFIYFRLIDFPVFNVADIYISCACFALALLLIFYYREDDLRLL